MAVREGGKGGQGGKAPPQQRRAATTAHELFTHLVRGEGRGVGEPGARGEA